MCVVGAVQVIVCCGYWDNSIRCYSSEEGRLLQSVRVHKDIVTCIELGSDGRTLASGVRALPRLLAAALATGYQHGALASGLTPPTLLGTCRK